MLKKKTIIFFLLTFIIFFVDRISKIYILNIAENEGTIDIAVNSFLNIILVWNSGIGFGLLSLENNLVYNLITLLIMIINLIIIYMAIKTSDIRSYFLIIVLGGSLGNLFDRIYYSAVPDFIDLNYNGYHWFVFNVADIFISIGIFALIFLEIFKKKNEK